MREYEEEFAAFILTNGRPDNVKTFSTLRKNGYTGKIFLLVDDLDSKKDQYLAEFGDAVKIFDKRAIAKTFDQGDNFEDMRAIIYARNAAFEIAKELGIKYFVQLDDDYTSYQYRFDQNCVYHPKTLKNLDTIFRALLKFFITSKAHSIAMAQGGDFIGGEESAMADQIRLKRKCMNSFFCSTDRPFKFVGRINEDVNAYTHLASKGLLMFTTNQVNLNQARTQSSEGGMTEMYLDSGTYVKSFYSVMYQPSSVKIKILNSKFKRLHHSVSWRHTAPLVLSESVKKRA
jgi:hypothetical protein